MMYGSFSLSTPYSRSGEPSFRGRYGRSRSRMSASYAGRRWGIVSSKLSQVFMAAEGFFPIKPRGETTSEQEAGAGCSQIPSPKYNTRAYKSEELWALGIGTEVEMGGKKGGETARERERCLRTLPSSQRSNGSSRLRLLPRVRVRPCFWRRRNDLRDKVAPRAGPARSWRLAPGAGAHKVGSSSSLFSAFFSPRTVNALFFLLPVVRAVEVRAHDVLVVVVSAVRILKVVLLRPELPREKKGEGGNSLAV